MKMNLSKEINTTTIDELDEEIKIQVFSFCLNLTF